MPGRSEVDAVSDGCGSDEEEEEEEEGEEKNRRHEAVPHVPGFVSLITDYRLLISWTSARGELCVLASASLRQTEHCARGGIRLPFSQLCPSSV